MGFCLPAEALAQAGCFVFLDLRCFFLFFVGWGERLLFVTPVCRFTSIRSMKRFATRVFSSKVKTLTALTDRNRAIEYFRIKVQKCFLYARRKITVISYLN